MVSAKTGNPLSISLVYSFMGKDLYIIRYLLLKYRLIFLRVLEVFDEPLGESDTERRVKV